MSKIAESRGGRRVRWATVAALGPAWRARLVDLGITVAVATVIEVAIEVAAEPDSRPAGLVGHLLGVLMALPLLVRRRWPVGTVYASAAVLLVYYASNFPGFPPSVVLVAQLYFAAEAGKVRRVLPVPVLFFAG